MTQEEYLECSHQTSSNSVYDKVNDDSDKSKNIVSSNQVNVAKNNIISRDIDVTGNIQDSGDKDYVLSGHSDIDSNNFNVKIDEVKSSHRTPEMTVITHQGSSENIREIQTKIENSEKSVDSGANVDENIEIIEKNSEKTKDNENVDLKSNETSEVVNINENKVNIIKSNKKSKTSKNPSVENEDAFARLNALKANISNVLKEVKAVLSEHGGEPADESEKEEIKSGEDNAIKFRFVRRIRKKSVFNEDDVKKVEQGKDEQLEKKDEVLSTSVDTQKHLQYTGVNKISTEPNCIIYTGQDTISERESIVRKEIDSITKEGEGTDISSVKSEMNQSGCVDVTPVVIPFESSAKSSDLDKLKVKRIDEEATSIIEGDQGDVYLPDIISASKIPANDKNDASINTIPESKSNDPKYEVKIVEIINITELPIQNKDEDSMSASNNNIPETDICKSTEKVLKRKVIKTKSSSTGEKQETKTKSQKNEDRLEKVKVKKTKSELETGKKTKKNSKEIVNAKNVKQEEEGSGNIEKTQKSKTKSKKIIVAGEQEPKASLPVSSENESQASGKSLSVILNSLEEKKLVPAARKSVASKEVESISNEEVLILEKNLTLEVDKGQILKDVTSDSEAANKDDVSAPAKDSVLVKPKKLVSVLNKNVEVDTQKEASKEIISINTTKNATKINKIYENFTEPEKIQDDRISAVPTDTELKLSTLLENSQKEQRPNTDKDKNQSKVFSEESPITESSSIQLEKSNTATVARVKDSLEVQSKSQTEIISKCNEEILKRGPSLENNKSQPKSGTVNALEKVLATTNLKLASEVRPLTASPVQSVPLKEQNIILKKVISQGTQNGPKLDQQIHTSTLISEDEVRAKELMTNNKQIFPAASGLGSDSKIGIRRFSLPVNISNNVTKMRTILTSSSEKIESKEKVSCRQDKFVLKEEKNFNDNITSSNKIGNVDIPGENENIAITKLEKKPVVDKVRIPPLKIDSDKFEAIVKKPTLTLLKSPSKANQMAPSTVELVPISKPCQVLSKEVVSIKSKGVLSSECNKLNNDSRDISEDVYDAHLPNEEVITSEQDKKLEDEKEEKQNSSTVEDVANDDDKDNQKSVVENTTGPKKRKMKKKVVIKRVKRRLSSDGSAIARQDSVESAELEICEKELKPPVEPEPELEPEPQLEVPSGPKSCLKLREFQPGEIVLYNDRIKKISKWKKAIVLERITSISYKLNVEGEEKSCHICYMKKYTVKKVQFGGKEYLEIDYAQDEDEEEEEKYNIWARV